MSHEYDNQQDSDQGMAPLLSELALNQWRRCKVITVTPDMSLAPEKQKSLKQYIQHINIFFSEFQTAILATSYIQGQF